MLLNTTHEVGSIRLTSQNFVHKFDVKVNGAKPLSVAKYVSEDEVTIGGKPLEYTKPYIDSFFFFYCNFANT
jgi:hypothetical protein